MLSTAAMLAFAFFCGSIPSGVWLARLVDVDVRRSGSGNIGATNVARTAGMRLGLMTLAADVGKGLVPVALARGLGLPEATTLLAGGAALAGHLFSPFVGFRGGRGVATAVGVFLAIAPLALAFSVIVFAATVASTRYVSLASVLAVACLPVNTAVLGYSGGTIVLSVAAAAAIVWRHRDNLRRLQAGQEPKFRPRR